MKRNLYLFILLFFPLFVVAEINITEIMFNPEEGPEWIELFYVGEDFNITSVIIADNNQADEIFCCNLSNCNSFIKNATYFLITTDNKEINTSSGQIYCVDDTLIGNGLGNSQDQIIIIREGEILVNVSYNFSTKKGKSLSYFNGEERETEPTPLNENEQKDSTNQTNRSDIEILFFLQEPLFTKVKYDSLFKIKNNDYSNNKDKTFLQIYYNISKEFEYDSIFKEDIVNISLLSYTFKDTGEIEFESPGIFRICGKIFNLSKEDPNNSNNLICETFSILDSETVSCNVSVLIKTDKTTYESGEKVGIFLELSNTSFPYKIEYWIEDLYGNTIKSKVITENVNKKSYTPIEDHSEKIYLLKANLTKIGCNNSNNKNYEEIYFFVKENRTKETTLVIEKINKPKKSSIFFGDTLKVDLQIYKGNTSKNSVKVYVEGSDEKISEIIYLDFKKRFQENFLSLPVILKKNCDKKYKEGNYFLIVEGLDKITKSELEIKNPTDQECYKNEDIKTPQTERQSHPYEIIGITNLPNSSEVISSLLIINEENVTHNYSLWSYIYKGSVSYSGVREMNLRTISLEPFSEKKEVLRNIITINDSGEYNLKIKILREDRKTPFEFTENISFVFQKEEYKNEKIKEAAREDQANNINNNLINQSKNTEKITGKIIYESSNEKLKNSSFLFLGILLLFIAFFIAKRRKYI